MKLINTGAYSAFLENLANRKSLIVTNVPSDNKVVIDVLNSLKHLMPALSFNEANIAKGTITVPIKKGKNKSHTITANKLIEELSITSVALTDDIVTTKNTVSGLFYSPFSDCPVYFSRATGVMLDAMTNLIAPDLINKYLDNGINLYEKHLKGFMPAIHVIEAQRTANIRTSQEARGFTNIPTVGDTVVVMGYSDMASMYGEDMSSAVVHFIKKQDNLYGGGFIKPLKFLCGEVATIEEFNKTTGQVKLSCIKDGKNIFDVTHIEIDGASHRMSPAPTFHEQILRRI